MYTPRSFQMKDQDEIMNFIRHYSFGMFISNGSEIPLITHLPFVVQQLPSGELQIKAHIATANPHWQMLESSKCLLVFNGPHAYVSPSWYKNPVNVPTWNYTSVHIKAHCSINHNTAAKEQLIRETIRVYEPAYEAHYDGLEAAYKAVMYDEIVGLDFEILGIEATFKLNQNKSKEDIMGVVQELEASGDTMQLELANMMKRFNRL